MNAALSSPSGCGRSRLRRGAASLLLLLAALPGWGAVQEAPAAPAPARPAVVVERAGEPALGRLSTGAADAVPPAPVQAAADDADEIAVADDDAPTVRAAGVAAAPAAPAAASAEPEAALDGNVFAANVVAAAVPDPVLDQVRGGFSDSQGLIATFGITRATYINGVLVAGGSVNIQDLRNITTAQAEQLRSVLSGFNLIQNGPGNVAPAPGTVTTGTLIQNSLNDQTIVNRTVLDASANSLQFIRAANAQTTLRDALTAPLGPR